MARDLEANAGSFWWKKLNDPVIKGPFADIAAYAADAVKHDGVIYSPSYYLNFSDLRKIILRKDLYRDVFVNRFGNNPVHLDSTLAILEPSRNTVAHNRPIFQNEVDRINTAWLTFEGLVGPAQVESLLAYPTQVESIRSRLHDEADKLESALEICKRLARLDWEPRRIEWWFDSEIIGIATQSIQETYRLMNMYSALPREVGGIVEIESWVRANHLLDRLGSAIHTLRTPRS